MKNINFYSSHLKLNRVRIPELAYACGFSRDFNSCLQDDQLDFFHQAFSGQFHRCIRLLDKHVPCISTLMDRNWRDFDLLWLFSIIKRVFCKSTEWISIINISQDSFKILESDSKKLSGFVLRFGALITRCCQELQKSMVEMIFMENF